MASYVLGATWTLGLLLTGCLCSCSLLFTPADTASSDAAPAVDVDASPAPAECTPATVADDCDAEAQCHCGQCAFADTSCSPSSLRYGAGTSPGGQCVAGATRLDTYYQHTCLLRSDGTAWCWGLNCDGQLGNHASDAIGAGPGCNAYSGVPVQVLQFEGGPPLDDIVDLQTGIFSTCALRSDGSVWCWGGNTFGQLGTGADSTALPFSLSPRRVVSSRGEPLENVEFIGSGGASVCATDSDRAMWCWGSNSRGQLQLGDGDFADRSVATRVSGAGPWRFIDGGGEHMCASRNGDIGADELWCWGRDVFGALGNGAADNPPLSEVDCNGSTDHPCFPTAQQVRDENGPLSKPSVVGLGNTFSCAASSAPSGLWCWGENDEHALGDESDLGNPVFGTTRYIATSVALDVGESVVQDVVAGTSFACARISDNLHCWGSDTHGQQGNGDSSVIIWQSPSSTPLLEDIRDVSAGFAHACAILADRSVQCWGDNGAGQLGVADDSNRDAPTAISPGYICP